MKKIPIKLQNLTFTDLDFFLRNMYARMYDYC